MKNFFIFSLIVLRIVCFTPKIEPTNLKKIIGYGTLSALVAGIDVYVTLLYYDSLTLSIKNHSNQITINKIYISSLILSILGLICAKKFYDAITEINESK